MGDILESSLTEMDWLLQLNGFTGADSDIQETSSEVKQEEDLDLRTCGQRIISIDTRNQHLGNCKVKPPYSYTYLITSAINSTTSKRMALSEIYQWIRDNYPYYRTAAPGWKNSVRHNLSLNKNFVKVARRKDEPGKGSYWALSSFAARDLNNSKLLPSFSQFAARYHGNTNNNNIGDNTHHQYVMTDTETKMAVQSINSIDSKHDISRTSSLSDELLECEEVLCEVELARSLLDSRHNNADLSQHVEWLKNSCTSKFLSTSLSSTNIDLDLLMESLRAVESSKKLPSLNIDQFTDLSTSFLSTSQPSPVKFIGSQSPTHSNSQQFSELQPLTLPTNIEDCDRFSGNAVYCNLRCSSPLPPSVLDHTEVISSNGQQQVLPPISVCSKYPQRTVVARHKSSANLLPSAASITHYNNISADDDIDDDFNWDNLIAKDNELMVCAS